MKPLARWGLLVALGTVGTAQAVEQTQLFESPRAWGRGGAYVAAHDSDEASRLNPATLGEADVTYQLRWTQFEGFVGENTLDTVGDIMTVATSNDGIGFIRKFNDKFYKRQYARGQLSFLSQRFGGFEMSPFGLNTVNLEVADENNTTATWRNDTVSGMNLAYGFEWQPGLNVGITLRPLYRWVISGQLGFVDTLDFLSSDPPEMSEFSPLVSGFGLGMDVGAIWQAAPSFRVGMTWHNMGDTEYFQSFGSEPDAIRERVSVGMLKRWQVTSAFALDYYLDIQDLTNRDGLNLMRLIHTGLEFGTDVFSRDNDFGVLAGLNEGYYSLGGFLDLYIFRVEIINYGVELGVTPGQRQDRRWGVSARSTMTF